MDTPTRAAAALPLLAARAAAAPIARVDGTPVDAARFLAEARALAERLPAGGEVVNLCADRYRFALGFAAALLRGAGSLFPPDARPQTLALLAEHAAAGVSRIALVDDACQATGGLPAFHVERTTLAPEAGAAPANGADPAHSGMPVIPGDLAAAVLLTSGSTGTPQPHAKRWRMLVHNIAAEARRLAEALERPDLSGLTLVATVPPQHSYGFESSVLLALLGGATFDGGRPYYPADIVAALERVPRPRALVTTPFHLKTLLASGLALPPVDLLLSATAPLSPQLAAEAERRTGGRLVEIYGCTEAGQVASRRTTAGGVWHTLGELRLWREPPSAPDEPERFLVQGGHVELPTPLADQLELLDERHFRLLGRANDLIHVGGKRSSLAHLNFHLNRVPGVVDGCFWLPEEDGETVARTVAFVVAPGLDAARVVEALRGELEPAFLPRRVVFVDALPRAATGKLTAQALREFAADRLERVLRRHIPADHPAFDGHFPGAPVLPGVVLLSELLEALLDEPSLARRCAGAATLEQVKFLAPVGPGTTLRLQLVPLAPAAAATAPRWQLEARREADGAVVARALLRTGPATEATAA